VPARVENRAGEYCQNQHAKCDYQREHRLLLSATNGTIEQMTEWRAEGAEALHSMWAVLASSLHHADGASPYGQQHETDLRLTTRQSAPSSE
jgi:hypothetical protein